MNGEPGQPPDEQTPQFRPRYLLSWTRRDMNATATYVHNYTLMRLQVLEELWSEIEPGRISIPINTGWC